MVGICSRFGSYFRIVPAMASRALTPALITCLALPLLAWGCGVDDTSAESEEGSESAGDGDGDPFGEETGEDPGPMDSYPATGISITHVEANQGTEVRIGEGGEWVDGVDRIAPLARKRNTLIRVHYDVDADFQPRELEARLILQSEDGATKVYTQSKMVEGPSEPNVLAGTFFFGLVADNGDVDPGMQYKVEIHEMAEGAGGGEAEGVWQTPPQLEPIGIQPEPIELKVMFVPYHHLYEGIDNTSNTTDEVMQVITDYVYEQTPVEKLTWELHEIVLWDKPMENLGSILGPLSAMRDNEMAFPNWYYHALFPVPNGGVAGVAGLASVPGPGKGEGNQRVSATALGNNVFGTRGTVVHEIGHNEGLQHVYCPFAMSASPDPNYPFENGVIGYWGFGILSFELYAPDNHYDYMSYCGPSWASRWSFRKTFERQRILTSWDYEDSGSNGDEKTLLFGQIDAAGEEFWWTAHGTMPSTADPYGQDYDHAIELRQAGETVDLLPAVIRYTNDYSTAWIVSELPEGRTKLEGIDSIARLDEYQDAHLVPVDNIQLSRRP